MQQRIWRALGAAVLAVSLGLLAMTQAQAQETQTFNAQLGALNGSGASGTATVTVDGSQLTVDIQSNGLAPGAPHAQHIHIGGQNMCPPASADEDGDGLTNTAEGQPFYGAVQISLTTDGDVSADSGLAVERFPAADDSGAVSYSRTFDLPDGVSAEDIANGVIVQHGIDLDGSGEYDGDAPSSLDESLPLEATIPATCGELVSAGGEQPTATAEPVQAPSTGTGPGGGATSTTVLAMLAGVGLAGGVLLVAGLRFRRKGA